MNSEEMRMELESFINNGLAQRWLGWPTKKDAAIAPPDRSTNRSWETDGWAFRAIRYSALRGEEGAIRCSMC